MRLEAVAGLEPVTSRPGPTRHLSPLMVTFFALAAAAAVGLTGTGVIPLPAAVGLDMGALACYLLALKSSLPGEAGGLGVGLLNLRGLEHSLVAVASLVGAGLLLATSPGLPWSVVAPIWLAVMLGLGPWLEQGVDSERLPQRATTALSCLVVTVPVAYLVVGLSPGLPAPVQASLVGLGCLVPSWRMVLLSGRVGEVAWERAGAVALLLASAAVLTSRLRVPGALLPVALLVAWYGLTGVASLRDRRQMTSFATFVVLAAAILAIAAPA
jgi:hypothetical protein